MNKSEIAESFGLNEIADWFENEAEERMKSVLARRTSPADRKMTTADLEEAKKIAEQMAGHKLDLVSTKPKDNIAYCDMQDRIAEKLETESRQLSAYADFLRTIQSDIDLYGVWEP